MVTGLMSSKIAQLHFREHVFRISEAISASLVTEVARPSFQHTFRRNRGSAKEGMTGDEDGPFGPVHLRYGCEY